MILFLDNAESILDPQGTEARDIYSVVEELSRFSNICLGITSRITAIPPRCKRPVVSTLTMEAAAASGQRSSMTFSSVWTSTHSR